MIMRFLVQRFKITTCHSKIMVPTRITIKKKTFVVIDALESSD